MAVVIIHTCPYGIPGVFIRPFVNFCVAIFLGLSGYLTDSEINLPSTFYAKRIGRVLMPYTIWSLIYILTRHHVKEIIFRYVTGYANAAFYYIIIYIELTLMAPYFGRLIHSKYRDYGYLVTPLALLIAYFVEVVIGKIPKPYNSLFFPVWMIYFYAGMVIRYELNRKVRRARKGIRKRRIPKNRPFGRIDALIRTAVRDLKTPRKRDVLITKLLIALGISIPLQMLEGLLWRFFDFKRMALTQLKLTSMITSLITLFLALIWIQSDEEIRLNEGLRSFLIYVGDISFGIYLCHLLLKDLMVRIIGIQTRDFFPLSALLLFTISVLFITAMRHLLPRKINRLLGFM